MSWPVVLLAFAAVAGGIVVLAMLKVGGDADSAFQAYRSADEHDDKANPLGIKGLGEIGIVGTAAAIANAVYHATGVRVRDLPITVDKLLAGGF